MEVCDLAHCTWLSISSGYRYQCWLWHVHA